MKPNYTMLSAACTLLAATSLASAQEPSEQAVTSTETVEDSSVDLAKTLANPIGALISVPFQSNFDFDGGPNGDGFQYKMNFQPIVPISLSEDWLLISRTVLPFIDQQDMIGDTSQTGLADTVQSFFFSPADPTESGLIWGAGPAFLLPTATDDLLGGEQWGAGPTLVALKQQGGWTYGALTNHLWSFAGDDARDEVSATYFQPFVSYTTKTSTTFTFNTEATFDWTHDQLTAPLNLMVQQVVKIGNQPIALTAGARYYADKPDDGSKWGLRLAVIFLFPKS
jgi:hypothetical protein